MKIGIMQPYFFPYIGYWQLLNAVDKYVIYDDVNYIKGGWINRNRILMNGEAKYFNVQLKDASPNKKINEVEVSSDNVAKKKMLNALEMNYRKAPYFNDVFPLLKDIILNETDNLAAYLIYSIKKVCEYLDIKTELIVSSTMEKNNALKGKEKVLHICELLGATEYYNAIGGRELYDYESFDEHHILLNFVKTKPIVYTQFKNDFIPNLSIIDVMMFNSKEEIKTMLNEFELINQNNDHLALKKTL